MALHSAFDVVQSRAATHLFAASDQRDGHRSLRIRRLRGVSCNACFVTPTACSIQADFKRRVRGEGTAGSVVQAPDSSTSLIVCTVLLNIGSPCSFDTSMRKSHLRGSTRLLADPVVIPCTMRKAHMRSSGRLLASPDGKHCIIIADCTRRVVPTQQHFGTSHT
eukprot:6212389-Pleurochrysis_carterae.AAC.1